MNDLPQVTAFGLCLCSSILMCCPLILLLSCMLCRPAPAQRLVEQFESLMLAAGPGAPEADSTTFPRPGGEERGPARAPQQPYDRANCSPDNMRPTVVGVPNSTALRLRWVKGP